MKRSNIARFGSETEVAIPDSAISFDSDQPMPPEEYPQGWRSNLHDLADFFRQQLPADKMAYLFFQSGGIFVQAFGFPFFEPCLFFQLHFSFDGSFIFFDISFHLSDFGVVAVLFE